MERKKSYAAIIFILFGLFLILTNIANGEVMFKEGKIQIPKFPATMLPENYEPPDWSNYPWHPWDRPKEFDINQPLAAEKIAWRMKDNFDPRFVYESVAFLPDENRFGHVRNLVGGRTALFLYGGDFKDLLDYHGRMIKPGDTEFYAAIFFNKPPQIRGLTNLSWKYLETPAVKKEQDRWVYVPALRRTRRLAAGADDDKLGGTDITVDDVGEREVWEEEHILIGTDRLGPDELNAWRFKPMGAAAKTYKPYLKKFFDCYVVLSINRKSKYYIPKRIIWYDMDTFLWIREEQYDFHGDLWKIYEWVWQDYTPKYGDIKNQYWLQAMKNIWDIKINHRTVLNLWNAYYDQNAFLGWNGKGPAPKSFFDVKRLEREEWGRTLPDLPAVKALDTMVPKPKLLRDRFKPYRRIVLPEELEKKLIEEYGE